MGSRFQLVAYMKNTFFLFSSNPTSLRKHFGIRLLNIQAFTYEYRFQVFGHIQIL